MPITTRENVVVRKYLANFPECLTPKVQVFSTQILPRPPPLLQPYLGTISLHSYAVAALSLPSPHPSQTVPAEVGGGGGGSALVIPE